MVLIPRMAAVLLVACLGAPVIAHTPGTPDVATPALALALQKPAAVVDAFHLALRQDRKADALALLADDALIFESGGIEAGKSAYAAEHLGADVEFAAATKTLVERRWGGVQDSIAWLGSEGRTRGAFRGRSVDQRTTETIVLRRDGGIWRIVHIHWSSRKAPEPDSRPAN